MTIVVCNYDYCCNHSVAIDGKLNEKLNDEYRYHFVHDDEEDEFIKNYAQVHNAELYLCIDGDIEYYDYSKENNYEY